MATEGIWQRTIGILGGLGPHAHLELERLLLDGASATLGRPARDQDYPPWILSSIPGTPDRTRALTEGVASPVDELVRSARRLEGADGADFAVIPCNAAHAFLPALRERVGIPFLDMVRETVATAASRVGPSGSIGLLSTDGTLEAGIYTDAAVALGVGSRLVSTLDLPEGATQQEELVMTPIAGPRTSDGRAGGGIKSGAHLEPGGLERLAESLTRAVAALGRAGAELVILGCTEIPLCLGRDRAAGVPLLDPMQVAAEACLDIARGTRALPE